MIKSEVINHEGNPGPNWLDHCRTVFTPWTATLLVLITAAAITVVSVKNHRTTGKPTTTNTSNTTGASSQLPAYNEPTALQVAPVAPVADDTATTAPNTVQSATGTVPGEASPQQSTTPAPTATNKTKVTSPSSALTQGKLNSRSLTKTLQSTLNSAQSVVNGTLKGLGL